MIFLLWICKLFIISLKTSNLFRFDLETLFSISVGEKIISPSSNAMSRVPYQFYQPIDFCSPYYLLLGRDLESELYVVLWDIYKEEIKWEHHLDYVSSATLNKDLGSLSLKSTKE